MICTIRRTTKDQMEELMRQGFIVNSVVENKHMKYKVTTPQGTEMTITTSKTPSDWRAQRKLKSQFKRFSKL